jgi:hypothetical protein
MSKFISNKQPVYEGGIIGTNLPVSVIAASIVYFIFSLYNFIFL